MDTYADGSGPIDLSQYQKAIQSVESGGNYGAVGPVTGSGDRAYGAYQVMGANVPDWTEKHYGQRLTPEQFVQNKAAQDAVFNGEFGAALQKHGNPQDAASVWFSGRPLAAAGNSSDGYNTVPQYVAKFNKALGGPGALSFASTDDDEEDPVTKLQNSGALATNNVVGDGALTPTRLLSAPKDDDRLSKVAQGLTGIGASIAGISSPQQSYALNQQLAAMKKDNEGKYKMMVTKDGRVLRIDGDGNIDSVGGTPAGTSPLAPQMLPVWGDTKLLGDDPTKATPQQQEAYISSMQGGQGALVRGILENTVPITANAFTRKDSPFPAAFAAAKKIDPTLDPTIYSARQHGQIDWASGKSSEQTRSLNQTIGHQSDVLVDAMKGLHNGDTPILNDIKNWTSEHIQGSGAVPGFRTSAHAVVDELGKVFKQNNLSDTEIRSWEKNLPDNMSPEQQRTQVAVFKKLMGGAMSALEAKREASIGKWAAAKAGPLTSADAQGGLQRLDDFANSGPNAFTPSTPAAAAPAPKGGNTFKTPTGKTVTWSY